MRTQVGIIGSGPAGLLLAQLLHAQGLDSVVVERCTPEHILGRIRAGVLERGTVAIVDAAGASERMRREGLFHDGVEFFFESERLRIDLKARAGGSVLIYTQTELTRDLMDARAECGGLTVYGAENVSIDGIAGSNPVIEYTKDGSRHRLDCDFIAGCDGFRGVSRAAMPEDAIQTFKSVYPFGWLGVQSDTKPPSSEFIYGNHPNGFALCGMRSMTRSRAYIQCGLDERVENWSDDRFWAELRNRLPESIADVLETGPSIEKSFAPCQSFVTAPMRYGRLFLAGDAAHIVPPTGAKGLNLAASDVYYLSEALIDFYGSGSKRKLEAYSDICLDRVWKAERFCRWMTSLLHRFPDHGEFERRIQLAELRYLAESEAAQTAIAENYIGLSI